MGLLDQLQAYIKANTPRSTRPVANPAQVIDAGLLGGRIGQIPQRAQEVYAGLLNAPRELAQLASPQMGNAVQAEMNNPRPANKQKWIDAGMELSGMAPIGGLVAHTVYHGSPHKFDKFDMSKIGTGEGAQAYGHGLYFAEAPEVAKSYADSLSQYHIATKDGVLAGGDFADALVANAGKYPASLSSAIRSQANKIATDIANGKSTEQVLATMRNGPYARMYAGLADAVENLAPSKAGGALYKVDLPDSAVAKMLDWDKPLSQQAPEVQAALEKSKNKQLRAMLDYAKVPYSEMAGGEAKTMGEAFRLLNLNLQGKSSADSAKASELLAKQGIPGIRYLDGSSRTTGQGTSNYVLFDDQLPRILEINGQPTGLLSYADEAKKAKKIKK